MLLKIHEVIKNFFKYQLRHGAAYREYVRNLGSTQQCNRSLLEAYQLDQLRALAHFAYEHVPFYRAHFRDAGLAPDDIRTRADWERIPAISKAVVRDNYSQFKARRAAWPVFKAHTSGSTGSPAVFLRDIQSISAEQAVSERYWGWSGWRPGRKRATLRGDVIVPVAQTQPPFWKIDSFSNELLLSGYHLSDANLALYAGEIKKFGAEDLYAYPSTAHLLADFCIRRETTLSFTAVYTSSEQLFDHQKETIEKAFTCRVFDWYGQAERVAGIGHCAHQNYHVMEDYSFVEFLPASDELHEVVGTSFHNRIMPLIRYRTGDLVELEADDSCACGLAFRRVKRISGRETACLRTPDGRFVSILNHIPRGVRHLREIQFVQDSLETIRLKVVTDETFSAADQALLLKNAREHISHDIHFKVERVSHIERSRTGKFIPVVSHVTG